MNKEQTKQTKMKFMMFENEENICWLDATLSLVAHNITIKKIVENSPESQILKIISDYNEAVEIFNKSSDSEEKVIKTKKILLAMQDSTSKYLKQFLKFKQGEPDSAFCALLNLIYQDKSNIKEHLNVSWIWRKQCLSCGVNSKSGTCLKPIITLSKVEAFHPECPTSRYTCTCKSEQEMKLIYKELPPCLIFHFEKGINTGTNFTSNFSFSGREYQLTSIVMLEKSRESNLNHFVTWIRNPLFNTWLECNDLNPSAAAFTPVKPEFNLKDVYIAVYEAFDSLDRINNDDEISIDQEQDLENSNVELIDLSDEETVAKNPESCENPCNSSSQSENASERDLKFTDKVLFDELNIEAKSDNSDYQLKANDEFIKTTEIAAEIDYKESAVREKSAENKNETSSNSLDSCKISTVENFDGCNIGETKNNEDCDNSNENIFNLPNEVSLTEHETKAGSDHSYCLNESIDSLTIEDTDISVHKVADVSDQNNEEKPLNLNSDTISEEINEDDISYKETLTEKKPTHNDSISDTILRGKTESDAGKNVVSDYDDDKLQLKMKKVSLKENKYIDTNEDKKEKVEDSCSLSKERTNSENVCSDEIKYAMNLNEQSSHTSSGASEIVENVFQNAGNASASKGFDNTIDNKKVEFFEKTVDSKAVKQNSAKEKPSNRNALTKEEKEELSRLISGTIDKTYATFFNVINSKREANQNKNN